MIFFLGSRGHLLKLITEPDLVHAFVLFSPVLTFGIVYPKKLRAVMGKDADDKTQMVKRQILVDDRADKCV